MDQILHMDPSPHMDQIPRVDQIPQKDQSPHMSIVVLNRLFRREDLRICALVFKSLCSQVFEEILCLLLCLP